MLKQDMFEIAVEAVIQKSLDGALTATEVLKLTDSLYEGTKEEELEKWFRGNSGGKKDETNEGD